MKHAVGSGVSDRPAKDGNRQTGWPQVDPTAGRQAPPPCAQAAKVGISTVVHRHRVYISLSVWTQSRVCDARSRQRAETSDLLDQLFDI